MARFHGEVGYADSVVTAPGVYDETIVEKTYYGDVVRNSRRLQPGESVNDDISLNHSIRIVADAYAAQNYLAIRYIRWMGSLYKVTDVEVERPRLTLRLGGVYNGPTGPAPDSP